MSYDINGDDYIVNRWWFKALEALVAILCLPFLFIVIMVKKGENNIDRCYEGGYEFLWLV